MLDGVVVVDKPQGPTSHDVVLHVRRASGEKRVGHAGTLDPIATGVLPLLLGRATRLLRFLPGDPKVYVVTARLGVETTTGDIAGEPVPGVPPVPALDDEAIARALDTVVGRHQQLPPMYSARKVGGTRLYRSARAGLEVDRQPATVTVHGIRLLARRPDALELEVHCSPGTYVRSLVTDLGRKLGTGATVASLRRTRSGAFDLADSRPLSCLLDPQAIRSALVPLAQLPLTVEAVTVEETRAIEFRNGRAVAVAALGPSQLRRANFAVRSTDGRLLGVGELRQDTDGRWELHPSLVLDGLPEPLRS